VIDRMTRRLRDAWNVLRGYAAAQDHRASAWAPSGGSANAEVGLAAPTVARRARDAVRNDPYASRIVDLWTGNAVGAGITTRWPDDAHGRAWQRWAESTACDAEGRLDLYGLQALVMRAVVESGECFVRFLMVPPSAANPIGLRLQVLESDHLDTARNGMLDGAATIQGIALGEAGEPIGYWLHRVHPGAAWIMSGATWQSSQRIPASEVLTVAIAVLPTVEPGDVFTLAADILTVQHAERDAANIAWRVLCQR
jgi:capsid protein